MTKFGVFIVQPFKCLACKWLWGECAPQMAGPAMAGLSWAWSIVTVLSAVHRDLGDKRRAPLPDNVCMRSIFNLGALCTSKQCFFKRGWSVLLIFPLSTRFQSFFQFRHPPTRPPTPSQLCLCVCVCRKKYVSEARVSLFDYDGFLSCSL